MISSLRFASAGERMHREYQLGGVLGDAYAALFANIVVAECVGLLQYRVFMEGSRVHVDRLMRIKLSDLIAQRQHVEIYAADDALPQGRSQESSSEISGDICGVRRNWVRLDDIKLDLAFIHILGARY